MKNVIQLAAVAVLAMSASVAFACDNNPPPNCSCKNGSWVNNTTNQTWNSNTNTYNTTNNNTTNNVTNNTTNKNTNVNGVNGNVGSTSGASVGNTTATGGNSASTSSATGGAGGAGGQGGAGGNATGGTASATGGSATGGSVANSGNLNLAAGAVTAKGGNQKQSQTQTQSNAITNSGNASIAAGAVQNTVAGGSSSIAAGAVQNTNTTGASTSGASASADGAGANSNNTTIESNYRAAKIPVATAYSAGLTSGLDTCLGSASGGVQTGIVGLTFGSTKVDKNCVTIKRTHLVAEFSIPAGCDYMLKHIPDAADSFKAVGAKCVPDPVVVVAPLPADAVTREELREVEKRITTRIVSK